MGSFYSTVSQGITGYGASFVGNTGTVFSYNQTALSGYDVTLGGSDNTKLYVNKTGVYEAWYSIQISSTSNPGNNAYCYIWIRKNGIDVPDSNGRISLNSNNGDTLPIVPYIISLNAGDYIEFVACSTDNNPANTVALALPETSVAGPAIPSIIVGVKEVAVDIGTTGPTGSIGRTGPTGLTGPCCTGSTGSTGPVNGFTLFNYTNRVSTNISYTALDGQYFIAVTPSPTTPITITLPTVSSSQNFYIIADESGTASTYPITITSASSISGASQIIINVAYGNVWIYSVPGSAYFVLFTRP